MEKANQDILCLSILYGAHRNTMQQANERVLMCKTLHLKLVSEKNKQINKQQVAKNIFNTTTDACCLTCTRWALHFAFDFSKLGDNILN